jgi:hypothetical protein
MLTKYIGGTNGEKGELLLVLATIEQVFGPKWADPLPFRSVASPCPSALMF